MDRPTDKDKKPEEKPSLIPSPNSLYEWIIQQYRRVLAWLSPVPGDSPLVSGLRFAGKIVFITLAILLSPVVALTLFIVFTLAL